MKTRLAVLTVVLCHCFFCTGNDLEIDYTTHHDEVLGTSLDLTIYADHEVDAKAAEKAVLDEIERLRKILSTYDPASEISKLRDATGPTPCSPDLLAVLQSYDAWNTRTNGAYTAQIGDAVKLWKESEKKGATPTAAELEALAAELKVKPYTLDMKAGTVTFNSKRALDLSSLGKGYIISMAVRAARKAAPDIRGIMINLGGDICLEGEREEGLKTWDLGVTDPSQPAENAEPLTLVKLRGAIATSGSYERFFTVGGKKYSHILDARTCKPADGVTSATVIAPDNPTANAIATTLCILPIKEGLEFVASVQGAECLVVAADGTQHRSAGFAAYEPAQRAIAKPSGKVSKWPNGFQVSIALGLVVPEVARKKLRSPYVAIWIEDSKGVPVRNITVWGNKKKYLRDLPDWWSLVKEEPDLVAAITRATRKAGRYTVVWDGLDDNREPVDPGTYTVQIEVHREHGARVRQTGKIACLTEPSSVKLPKRSEVEATIVTFGPRK